MIISEFDIEIKFIKGSEKNGADSIARNLVLESQSIGELNHMFKFDTGDEAKTFVTNMHVFLGHPFYFFI